MFKNIKGTVLKSVAGIALTAVLGASAWAGGFWVETGLPSAEAAKAGVVVNIRPMGCHQPANAIFQGEARGIVDGKHQTVGLRFARTSDGLAQIQRTWPEKGVWVLTVTASYRGATYGLLMETKPDNPAQIADGAPQKEARRAFTAGEIESALQDLASRAKSLRASR